MGRLIGLDDEIHELLEDSEYEADPQKREENTESAKRAILRVPHKMEIHLSTSTANFTINFAGEAAATVSPIAPSAAIYFPAIKLEPISGDIETWARIWKQFKQLLTTINKQILLRGYIEEEPEHLVEGIAVIGEKYDETKKVLEDSYGDKNRIIQAHLDYLEDVKP